MRVTVRDALEFATPEVKDVSYSSLDEAPEEVYGCLWNCVRRTDVLHLHRNFFVSDLDCTTGISDHSIPSHVVGNKEEGIGQSSEDFVQDPEICGFDALKVFQESPLSSVSITELFEHDPDVLNNSHVQLSRNILETLGSPFSHTEDILFLDFTVVIQVSFCVRNLYRVLTNK